MFQTLSQQAKSPNWPVESRRIQYATSYRAVTLQEQPRAAYFQRSFRRAMTELITVGIYEKAFGKN